MSKVINQDSDFMTMKERKIYNKWRLRILISIIFGYGTYYLCRQNFSMIMPAFMEEFGYSKMQLGWILTTASIVYGIGKFINGYLSDKSNARYFMPLGLFCSAIITFILGFSESLIFLGIFWALNNWFQSMGWPPAARMLTHWFAPKELGTKWALGAASHQVGGAITLVFTGYLVTDYGWRYAFFIPAIIATIIALILINRLRESPKELGMPPVEAYKGNENFVEDTSEDHLTAIEIIKKVFVNKNLWLICFANMCVYIVRIGIIFWAPLFLKEVKGISLSHAGWQVAASEVTGLLGGFSAGWISDKLLNGQRGPVGTFFMLCLAMALALFWYMPDSYVGLRTVALILVGFFVYGPQVLIGVASADFASKKAVGTANGLAGTMGYVGSGISGVCVGALIDNFGWQGAFMFFIGAALLGSVFFLLTWRRSKKSEK
ncbi:MFS transporter [Rickettsiaceae bacterium]|nr:MFS transporter [Rickettsiaceae bacterium]